MYEYGEEENCCEPYIVKCIMEYSYCQTQVTECCNSLYVSNANIKECIDGIASIKHSLLTQCYFIEPLYENWLCIVWLDENGHLKEEYSEIIELSFDVISLAQKLMFTKKNKSALSILKLKKEYFINIHKTFYNIYFTGLTQKINGEINEKHYLCNYLFFSIVYIKDADEEIDPPEPISIDIDKNYYMVGNIILTPAFIARELSYKNISLHLFDPLNYMIEIMDHNMNVFTIQSDQYILLEKDDYKIMTIESEQSESSEDINIEII